MTLGIRSIALLSVIAAALAWGVALAAEHWGGLVPCAFCLLERWPYRVAIVLGMIAALVPQQRARWVLWLLVLTIAVGAAMAVVHVGVEQHFWPDPIPSCAAPRFSGGSIAQRLAQMPAQPAKPCDAPTFLIPGLPLSMAAMNLIYALVFAALLASYLWRDRRSVA